MMGYIDRDLTGLPALLPGRGARVRRADSAELPGDRRRRVPHRDRRARGGRRQGVPERRSGADGRGLRGGAGEPRRARAGDRGRPDVGPLERRLLAREAAACRRPTRSSIASSPRPRRRNRTLTHEQVQAIVDEARKTGRQGLSRQVSTGLRAEFPRRTSARADPCDWPSQNIACLRTSGFRLVRATSISFGTPSSFGSWLSANTAFFFTSVSGSLSIAPVIVADRLLAGLLREPEQRLAAHAACSGRSRAAAMSAVSADGTLLTDRPKVTFSRTLSLGSCCDHARRAAARRPRRASMPSQNAVSPRSHSGSSGATNASSVAIGRRRVVQRDGRNRLSSPTARARRRRRRPT